MTLQKTAQSITARKKNFSQWYLDTIQSSDLADHSPVRGCMIIKPWGYAIWERIQQILDKKLKDSQHENVYFPLLIPLSFIEKEFSHIEGFAKECAVVTHSRLKSQNGKLKPDNPLEEPYIIRPTSETIIGSTYASWIKSYRDLPIKINQWANVMRWELRPRLFLRTSEFLWQEGHTIHESKFEAEAHTLTILDLYSDFIENHLAIPVFKGIKTPNERFPGAVETYCLEAVMQDGKAIQSATSHFLGQNFSKAFNIAFTNKEGKQDFTWTTSWGVSTRLIGSIIMSHGDDNGLILPPRISPKQVVIIPLLNKIKKFNNDILLFCKKIQDVLESNHVSTFLDQKDHDNDSEKIWKNIKKGIPIKIEIGPNELQNQTISLNYRTWPFSKKISLPINLLTEQIHTFLNDIQIQLYNKALINTLKYTREIYSIEELENYLIYNKGFATCFWHSTSNIDNITLKYKITIRCILLENDIKGLCLFSQQETCMRILLGKSY